MITAYTDSHTHTHIPVTLGRLLEVLHMLLEKPCMGRLAQIDIKDPPDVRNATLYLLTVIFKQCKKQFNSLLTKKKVYICLAKEHLAHNTTQSVE